jgi:hypothetical protein
MGHSALVSYWSLWWKPWPLTSLLLSPPTLEAGPWALPLYLQVQHLPQTRRNQRGPLSGQHVSLPSIVALLHLATHRLESLDTGTRADWAWVGWAARIISRAQFLHLSHPFGSDSCILDTCLWRMVHAAARWKDIPLNFPCSTDSIVACGGSAFLTGDLEEVWCS